VLPPQQPFAGIIERGNAIGVDEVDRSLRSKQI
jgi:hypothetical protein